MKIEQNLWDSLETIRTQGTIDRKAARAADVANVTPERRGWLIRAFAAMYRAAQGSHTQGSISEQGNGGDNLSWVQNYLEDTLGISSDWWEPSYWSSSTYRLNITINPQDSTEHEG